MSTVKVDTWKNGAGTRTFAPCTAWVNFNGTGTVAIRDQLNVSSITDNGVGDYTVNFTTAMADSNYSIGTCATPDTSSQANGVYYIGLRGTLTVPTLKTTGAFRIITLNTTPTVIDSNTVMLQIFGGI